MTRSMVSVTLSHEEHNIIYTCQATNDVGQTVADTVTLSVLCKSVCQCMYCTSVLCVSVSVFVLYISVLCKCLCRVCNVHLCSV